MFSSVMITMTSAKLETHLNQVRLAQSDVISIPSVRTHRVYSFPLDALDVQSPFIGGYHDRSAGELERCCARQCERR